MYLGMAFADLKVQIYYIGMLEVSYKKGQESQDDFELRWFVSFCEHKPW